MSKHFSDLSQSDKKARWDYGGLEVDTRAADNTDKHLDPYRVPKPKRPSEDNDIYLHEKEIHVEERESGQDSPSSTGSPIDGGTMGGATMVPETPCTPGKPCTHEGNTGRPCLYSYDSDVKEKPLEMVVQVSPPEPKPRKICGMRRRNFWILFAVVLGIIVIAAIVGGAIAGTRKTMTPSPPPSTESVVPAVTTPAAVIPTPSEVNTPLKPQDVIADSPMSVISYTNPGAPNPFEKQTFRMFFQSVVGNVKEVISDAFGPWQSASPLFTDAVNNTGLASISWENLTDNAISGTIFYIDGKFKIQEKRKKFNDSLAWEQATLSSLGLTTRGSVELPDNNDNDPVNDWDGYRLAAVYSRKFVGGPQARLFYRAQDTNGSNSIEEVIWNHTNDRWSKGATFNDSWPTSHFAASIDEETNILRLFYSTGRKTLQEYWTDITTPETAYKKGFSAKNYLSHNNADISAVSLNGTTYLYHYNFTTKSIQEMTITGNPSDVSNQETFNTRNKTKAVAPASAPNSGKAVYQPFAAAATNVVDLNPSLIMFWAESLAGMNATAKTEGGYSRIGQIRRARDDAGWPSEPKIVEVPLGDKNSEPWIPE